MLECCFWNFIVDSVMKPTRVLLVVAVAAVSLCFYLQNYDDLLLVYLFFLCIEVLYFLINKVIVLMLYYWNFHEPSVVLQLSGGIN